MIIKGVFILLFLMFMAFAFVQINDPDPVIWILMYGAMAIVCIMAAFDYYVRRLMIILVIVYIGFASTLFSSASRWLVSPNKAMLFDDVAKMENLYIEESREFLGLMICLVVLAVCFWRSQKHR
jgi:Transmembrane family 220, helix